MRVARLTIDGYRGFDHLEINPRGHVLLLGEPRAGRTDLLGALDLALLTDGPRGLTEFDFHARDLTRQIQIEVTLLDLSPEQQQEFLDHLDLFDPDGWAVVPVVGDPEAAPQSAVPAVRVGYHARWDGEEQEAVQNRYWVKGSDPAADEFKRLQRSERASIGFVSLSGRRPLNLAPRGGLRMVIDERDQMPDLLTLLDTTTDGVGSVAEALATTEPVASALEDIFELLRRPLEVGGPIDDLVRLAPDGGSLAAMLRGLVPTIDLGDGGGYLPLTRHGSTTTSSIEAAELVTQARTAKAIVTVDDFGDTLDGPTAQHLSEQLRHQSGQLWLSTRRPETARGFHLDEVFRLSRSREPGQPVRRRLNQAPRPERRDLPAHRELHRQLLPAAAARTIVIVEGPDDLAGYRAVDRIIGHDGGEGIAGFGAAMIDPGPKGGIEACAPLARLARSLGFRTIVICDYDRDTALAQARLDKLLAEADHVIRLPHAYAIEAALLDLTDERVIAGLTELSTSYDMSLPAGWETLDSVTLRTNAYRALKSNGGLHAQFAYATTVPPAGTAARVLEAVRTCAAGSAALGHIQL